MSRVEQLVKDLLDFSKPRCPKLERINIDEIISQTLQLVQHDFLYKKIKVVGSNSNNEA